MGFLVFDPIRPCLRLALESGSTYGPVRFKKKKPQQDEYIHMYIYFCLVSIIHVYMDTKVLGFELWRGNTWLQHY